ncbi:flagellar hook-basal body complex protein FliE [Desulfosediminicola flagellatus]|uniref:flagellar hook-basal body complex protein FliE n=1 Tax=Desulfosediminicola flagellatus TaxID=2569541 RepID=UPI0010AB5EAB|nr:flagellar hook-basal body complex protein FliE [Desulfosediminicola flagellatus]
MSITPIITSQPPMPLRQPDTSSVSQAKSGFGEILSNTLSEVNQEQTSSEAAVERLHSGGAKHLHEVIIAVEQADVSLRMLVQMRNKVQQAYEEIMRMQI